MAIRLSASICVRAAMLLALAAVFFAHALGPQRDENRLNPPGIQMRQQLWSTDYDLSVQNFVIRDEVLVGTLKAKAPVRHPAFANDQKEGGNLHIRVVIPLHRVNRLDLERIVNIAYIDEITEEK